MCDGTGEFHRAQAIISGGGGLAMVLTVSVPLFSISFVLRALSRPSTPSILMGFRSILRRCCGTYVNIQYTGNPGSSLSQCSSTANVSVWPVYKYYYSKQYI